MAVPIWAGHYIGLPFKGHGRDRSGVDCWGLVRLMLAEQFSIALPSFSADYNRTTDIGRISDVFKRETTLTWRRIANGHERIGDIVVFRLHGEPMHVGLVLGDDRMLHVERDINSAIEPYQAPRWKDRIYGFFRYDPFMNGNDFDE